MNDEQWMRAWHDNHARFGADIDRGVAALAGAIARLRRRRDGRDAQLRGRIGISG